MESNKIDKQSLSENEDDALPFSGDAFIEYGSLSAYPPYVPSPPTSLKHAIELASKWGKQNENILVEVGCGKGEFIMAIEREGWFQSNKAKLCLGIDIN